MTHPLRKMLNIGEKTNEDTLISVLAEKTASTDITMEMIENSWNIYGFLSNDHDQECECKGTHHNFVVMRHIKTKEFIVLGKSCYEQIWDINLDFIFETVQKLDGEEWYKSIINLQTIYFVKYLNGISQKDFGLLKSIYDHQSLYDTSSQAQKEYRYGICSTLKDIFSETNISKIKMDEIMFKMKNNSEIKDTINNMLKIEKYKTL